MGSNPLARARRLPALTLVILLAAAGTSVARPPAFGTGSLVRTTPRERLEGPWASIETDKRSRIDVVGAGQNGPVAIRYLPNGALDPAFGIDGESDLESGAAHISAEDLALDRRGRLLIGGTQFSPEGSSPADYWFALERLRPNGAPDKSFGKDGLALAHVGFASDIEAISVDARNRIVAVGSTQTSANYANQEYVVARFLPDGRLDHSFSGDGIATGKFGSIAGSPARAVAIDRRGRILIGGRATDRPKAAPVEHLALIRFTESGRFDSTFGRGGEVKTNFAKGTSGLVSIAIDRHGRIVSLGNWSDGKCGASGNASLARFLPDGRPDRSFSGDGRAIARVDFSADAFAIDQAGRFVIAGNTEGCKPIGWAVARLAPDGTLDPRFGDHGLETSPALNSASAITLDQRGRPIAGGVNYPKGTGAPEFILRRFSER